MIDISEFKIGKFKTPPSRNAVLTVTTPTCDFSVPRYLKSLIFPHTSYQIIPSLPRSMLVDVQEVLNDILPLTQNIFLDVALPFHYFVPNDTRNGSYFGRYLIYDQRLVGIRLSSSKNNGKTYPTNDTLKWPIGLAASYKTPKCFLDFYNQKQFQERSYKRQVLIGDFLVTFGNVRMGLLFESEIQQCQSLLVELKHRNCDIISVMSDLPRDNHYRNQISANNVQLPTLTEKRLKNFVTDHKKIVMYCGCRMAPYRQLFLANSFISHPELPIKEMEPHMLNQGGTLSLVCELPPQKKSSNKPEYTKQGLKDLKVGSLLRVVNTNPHKLHKTYIGQSKNPGTIKADRQKVLNKLKVWYVYKNFNKGCPFTVSLPFSINSKVIYSECKTISTYLEDPLSKFIVFYKRQAKCDMQDQLKRQNVAVYQSFSELFVQNPTKKHYIYTDNPHEINFLFSFAQTYTNVYICHKLMNFTEEEYRSEYEKKKLKMEEFASLIIRTNSWSFEKILQLAYRPQWNFNSDEIMNAVFNNLRAKLRCQFVFHPFFTFLLEQNDEQRIKCMFSQAEFVVKSKSNRMLAEEPLEVPRLQKKQSLDNNPRLIQREMDLKAGLQNLKKQQAIQLQKNNRLACHRCMCYLHKTVVFKCYQCKTQTCYACIQIILKQQPKQRSKYEQCYVCQKLCLCQKCRKRSELIKQQVMKQKIEMMKMNEKRQLQMNQNSQQNIPMSMQVGRRRRDDEKEGCSECLFSGRSLRFIRIFCDTCDRSKCLSCLLSNQMNDRKFIKSWTCDVCDPPIQKNKPIGRNDSPPAQNIQRNNSQKMQKEKSKSRSRSAGSRSKSIPKKNKPRSRSASRSRSRSNKNNDRERSRDNLKNNGGYNRNDNRTDFRTQNRGQDNFRGNRGQRGEGFNRGRSYNDNKNNFSSARQNDEEKRRSPSRSKSPQRKKRSPSRSKSPPRKKRSASRSKSFEKKSNKKITTAEKKRSVSASKSRSKSPQKKKSASKSRSKSRSAEKKNVQISQKPLWNAQSKNKDRNDNKGYDKGFNNRNSMNQSGSSNKNNTILNLGKSANEEEDIDY